MSGIHIISDFYGCENKEILLNESMLKQEVKKLIDDSGMIIVGETFYKFKNAGVTGVFLLAESHLSIHTWPEKDSFLNLDIFLCDYSENNDSKAKKLFEDLKELFQPTKDETQIIQR